MIRRTALGALAIAASAALLAGCVAKADVAAADKLTVQSTDSTCAVSTATITSGTIAFDVTNGGSDVTEFYLLAEDGLRIVGEVENVAPGASRTLTVTAQPGNYFTLCKPGMIGEGVGRASFSVTGDKVAVAGADAEQKQQAVTLFAAFVKDQVGQLLPATKALAASYVAGDDAAARTAFPQVRSFYERIEPVASTLGDLDPSIDYREIDAVAEGLTWSGFHRIEKDLWVPAQNAVNSDKTTPAWQNWAPSTPAERTAIADKLTSDVQGLYDYVHSADFQTALDGGGIATISNGAISLLDEVATKKITGEEDWWSGTDLYDFAANVEGAKMSFSLVQDFATAKGDAGAKLVTKISAGFTALETSLAKHGSLASGFIAYTQLGDADKRELTDLINALAEPLSQLTTTILN